VNVLKTDTFAHTGVKEHTRVSSVRLSVSNDDLGEAGLWAGAEGVRHVHASPVPCPAGHVTGASFSAGAMGVGHGSDQLGHKLLDMGMRTQIEDLVQEAEELIRNRVWVLTPDHRMVLAKAAADLHAAVGTPQVQETLPATDRLEHLREALAAVAIALAHVHGHTAWFLGAVATSLTPVLHWRALPAGDGHTFGAVVPTPLQYAEAEDAVRQLRNALARIASA
jgi:hypothetical protein